MSKKELDESAKRKLMEVLEESDADEETKESIEDMLGIGKISETLVKKDKIKFLSIIDHGSKSSFSVLYALNSKLKSGLLESYLEHNLTLAVSVNGQGRKDMVDLSKHIGMAVAMAMGGNPNNMDLEKQGFINRLRGKT